MGWILNYRLIRERKKVSDIINFSDKEEDTHDAVYEFVRPTNVKLYAWYHKCAKCGGESSGEGKEGTFKVECKLCSE
jgi:hypothetical protein